MTKTSIIGMIIMISWAIIITHTERAMSMIPKATSISQIKEKPAAMDKATKL